MAKTLDVTALTFIKKEREKGVKYELITKDLNEMGYTSSSGKRLHMAQVGNFAISNGVGRVYLKRPKRKYKIKSKKPVTLIKKIKEAPQKENLLMSAYKAVAKLSDSQKREFINSLMD